MYGGETGIRTLDTLSSMPPFQGGTFNHSAISPLYLRAKLNLTQSKTDCIVDGAVYGAWVTMFCFRFAPGVTSMGTPCGR